MRDIVDVMNIIAEEKEVSIEKILYLLESNNPRWVKLKGNKLCQQYPNYFEPIFKKNKIIGFKKK